MDQHEFIKYLRDLAGNNQSRLASMLGVSASYLSYVLSGRRSPGKKILDAVGFEKTTDYHEKGKAVS